MDNQPKRLVLDMVERFFKAGYRQYYLLFGGHGDELGRLVVRQTEECDKPQDRTISYTEFCQAKDKSMTILPGIPGEAIINCCYSHLFVPGLFSADSRGFRIYSTTSEKNPLLPPDGFAAVQRHYLMKYFNLKNFSEIQSDDKLLEQYRGADLHMFNWRDAPTKMKHPGIRLLASQFCSLIINKHLQEMACICFLLAVETRTC